MKLVYFFGPTENRIPDGIIELKCESWNYKHMICPITINDNLKKNIEISLKKQHSKKTKCKKGKNFGYSHKNTMIWVNNGCRATFTVNYGLF